ncbi:MAG TPA: glycosyltransferase family 4 protein [Pseudolabrys sp.]|nr:glycosyltransferase family 4 protein [Pseudolabrys sp.]
MQPLHILHIFRSPVGGLFRHVLDVAQGQIARGHKVGMVVSNLTGGEDASRRLAALAPQLALGLTRIPMRRLPHPSDLAVVRHLMQRTRQTKANVIHGHGAKGGAYVRLVPAPAGIIRALTPHGGSLHFGPETLSGRVYLAFERLLMRRRTLYLFESAYAADTFRKKIGEPRGSLRVIHNGVGAPEFDPVLLESDATDLVFLGELRHLKGVDVLLAALSQLHRSGRTATLSVIGDGPLVYDLRARASELELAQAVRFLPPMPARLALAKGQMMVVPSRSESLPYVVLEAAAAARPLVATRVGGIPEIFGPQSVSLVPPGDSVALAEAIRQALDDPHTAGINAERLQERIASDFSVDAMVAGIIAAYQQELQQLVISGVTDRAGHDAVGSAVR